MQEPKKIAERLLMKAVDLSNSRFFQSKKALLKLYCGIKTNFPHSFITRVEFPLKGAYLFSHT